MSVAEQITALTTDKTNIRDSILAKGGTCPSENGFDDFATDIGTIPSGITPSGNIALDSSYTVQRDIDIAQYATASIFPALREVRSLTLGADAPPSSVEPASGYALTYVNVYIDPTVIQANNIAEGATILGIEGTHGGGGEQSYAVTIVNETYYRMAVKITCSGKIKQYNLGARGSITVSGLTYTLSELFSNQGVKVMFVEDEDMPISGPYFTSVTKCVISGSALTLSVGGYVGTL